MSITPFSSGFGSGNKPPLTQMKYNPAFEQLGSLYGGLDKIPDSVKEKYAGELIRREYDPEGPLNRAVSSFLEQSAYANTPKGRQEILEQQLAFDRARGEQMQKYRMINDTIANLGQAARAAGGGYGLTPDYLGQSYANVGNAYLAGLQSMPRVAPQVGQKYF